MKQKKAKNRFKKISIDMLLIGGVILLLATVTFFLLQNIKSARLDGVFADRASITEQLLKKKQIKATSVKDIESIDSWMTFQYINLIFSLPESYLQEQLAITDKKYPNIPIWKYTKKNQLDRMLFIKKVKDAVNRYVTNQPTQN